MSIEEYLVASACGEFSRKVWLLRGAQARLQTLCVFLDAEYYLDRMDTLSLVKKLQTRDLFKAVTWVFVSHGDNSARHSDFVCNNRYSRYIAEDVVGWVRQQCAGIAESNHLVCGLSLSGLASAYLALTYPQQFSRALCQSGSFWWNRERLARKIVPEISSGGKFWISVGDKEVAAGITHAPSGMVQEVSQLVAVENIVRELKAVGATVHYHPFAGGHQTTCWQAELPAALEWLLHPHSMAK